jgi:predicted  nucleic acid-binding Zn-ribbon protein
MQLHCTYCQNMFAISQEEMLAGLEHMEENKLTYYDAHCPKCRRANRVERARMERFFPEWKKVIKTMTKAADQAEGNPVKPAETSQPEKNGPKAVKRTTVTKKK